MSEAEMRRRAIRRADESDAPAPARKVSTDIKSEGGEKKAPAEQPAPAPVATTATNATPNEPQSAPRVSNEKPALPLTEVERRAVSIANLEKIGQALIAFAANNRGKLPAQASSTDGEAFLSWRVLILPELGYPELRQRFRHERWDSPHNKVLLDYIPPEYQSPERFDVKTNYLGISGPGAIFPDLEGLNLAEIKDGADNVLAVVEVDDKYAQEWTRPADHIPLLAMPGDKLAGLRGEGAFGAMASGRIVLLPRELPPSRLAALFTVSGGEPIGAATFLQPPTPEPPPPMLATIADDPAAANQPTPSEATTDNREPTADSGTATAAPLLLAGSLPYVPDPAKEPVPHEESLAKARELLKELYGEDFQKARKPEEQQQFLKKLLADAPNVEQNPADYHELVRIARDLAAMLGDVSQALAACDLLEQRFQVDSLSMRIKVLDSLSKHWKEGKSAKPALKEAQRIQRDAFDIDRFEVALLAHEVVLSFARIDDQKPVELKKIQDEGEELETAKRLYIAAERGLATLQQNINDAAANEAVGRYLCLVKNRWEAGLPYMIRADDIRLRGIASHELSTNRSLEDTLSLADQYWELAARFKQPQRRGLHLRAIYCYGTVASRLATSLEKIKIQRRIDEATRLYDREEIDRVLAPLGQKVGGTDSSAKLN
jgi:hypothetical protein